MASVATERIVVEAPTSATTSENSILDECDVIKVLTRRLNADDFKLVSWSLDLMGKQRGFVGAYYHLSAAVVVQGETCSFRFFVKTPPNRGCVQYDFITRLDSFNKEIHFYEDIVQRLGVGSRCKWLPQFYLGKRDVVIVMEDATMEEFLSVDKFRPFDLEHCNVLMRSLANLHGRSIIADEKLKSGQNSMGAKSLYELFPILQKEVIMGKDEMGMLLQRSSIISAYKTIDAVCANVKSAESAKARFTKWCDSFLELCHPSRKYRNAISHRDLWANNILFKKNHLGEPTGSCLIDYQLTRYSPPALDIVMALYLTSDRRTRKHLNHMIRAYHEELAAVLQEEGLDVNQCLPLEELETSVTEAMPVGLVYSMLFLTLVLLSDDVMENLFKSDSNEMLKQMLYGTNRYELVVKYHMEHLPEYRARIVEIVEELVECLPEKVLKW